MFVAFFWFATLNFLSFHCNWHFWQMAFSIQMQVRFIFMWIYWSSRNQGWRQGKNALHEEILQEESHIFGKLLCPVRKIGNVIPVETFSLNQHLSPLLLPFSQGNQHFRIIIPHKNENSGVPFTSFMYSFPSLLHSTWAGWRAGFRLNPMYEMTETISTKVMNFYDLPNFSGGKIPFFLS